MTARRQRLVSSMLIAAGVLLAGCTPAPTAPTAPITTVAATPTPTPTATAEEIVVAGGERPPIVGGGDCGAVVSVEALAAATGRAVDTLAPRDPVDAAVGDVGGLACEFQGPEISGQLYVFPVAGFVGTGVAPVDAPALTDRCVNACEWRHLDADVFVVGFVSPQDYGLAEAAAAGAVLGTQISAAAVRTAGEPWRRDTSRWWSTRDCAEVAAAVSERTGVPFTGAAGSFYDALVTGIDVAWVAERRTECTLDDPATSGPRDIAIAFTSGTAWSVPASFATATPYDPGVAGITGYSLVSGQSVDPIPGYELTDGVNAVSIAFAEHRDDTDAVVAAVGAISAR